MKRKFCAKILSIGLLIAALAATPAAIFAAQARDAAQSSLTQADAVSPVGEIARPASEPLFPSNPWTAWSVALPDGQAAVYPDGLPELPRPIDSLGVVSETDSDAPAVPDAPVAPAVSAAPAAPAAESAEEGSVVTVEVRPLFASVSASDTTAIAQSGYDLDAIRDYLRAAFQNYETEIDVSQFGILQDDFNVLMQIVWNRLPECFHLQGSLTRWSSNGIVTKLAVGYTMTKEAYQIRLDACTKTADWILQGLRGNGELTDVEKALLIHDRLALWCEYDMRLNTGNMPEASYRMDGVLVEGVAVCQGYAETYGYLLDQVGIKNDLVTSELNNHAWNLVYIDGIPYHTDVTWDDPINDITGRVMHVNFLRSTDGIISTGHKEGDFTTEPKDTRYDNAYWQTSDSSFVYLRGGLYSVEYDSTAKTSTLYRRDGDDVKALADLPTIWRTTGNAYYPGAYSRLASDGTDLLVSQPDGIYRCDALTGEMTPYWIPDQSEGYCVYGFAYLKGELICESYVAPNYADDTKALYQKRQAFTVGEISGDADGDGIVAPMDLYLLQRYLNGLNPDGINESVCDLDGDTKLSMRDLVMLRRFLNGLTLTPIG